MRFEEAKAAIARLGAGVDDRAGSIRLELEGPIARIAIDNPTARNAITLTMMAELAEVIEELGDWDGAIAVLHAASGSVFCSGGHLGQVLKAVDAPEHARTMARAMGAILDALLALPVVTVCAIDGLAVGGGAEIATATDFRVAGPSARIHFVHAALGIAPGWGGAARLVTHVGSRTALRILAEAVPIGPEQGVDLGLFDAAGPELDSALDAFVAPMLERPATAIRAVKAQIAAARAGDREAEVQAFGEVWGSPPHVAALQRIRGRRG